MPNAFVPADGSVVRTLASAGIEHRIHDMVSSGARIAVVPNQRRRCGGGGRGFESLVLCLFLVLWCFGGSSGFPAPRRSSHEEAERHRRSFIGDNVQSYLMQFGYLPQSDLETGNLRTEEQLRDAIKTLQAFANLTTTGIMDSATRGLLKKPRCGLPDIATSEFRSKRYILQGQKWHTTNLTWSLRTQPGRGLDRHIVRRELSRALNVWAENSKLNFNEVDSDRADILVYFYRRFHGDGYPFDGPGQILAHAFFPGSGRGGDAHFDEDEIWLTHEHDDEGTSLFAVAAHEFGHSLGLSHSSVAGALMYPWYQGVKKDFKLPNDDRYGIQQLYGAKEDKEYGPIVPYVPTTQPPRRPERPPKKTERPDKPTPPTYYPPKDKPEKPDTCDTSYDAISVIRREIFIFKGKYFWRVGEKGLERGYPVLTTRFWYNLPHNFTHVDAVYERSDKKIVFFIGKQYWVFNANYPDEGYPKPLTDLGLPSDLEKIDGAMVWGHNGKTYFFSETMYWRFDEDEGKVELDYPRDMAMWSGVGYNVDAVFQWKDGVTYFFKGKGFWKFNDQRMRVESETQSLSAPFWMGCPTKLEGPRLADPPSDHSLTGSAHGVKKSHMNSVLILTIVLLCIQRIRL